MSEIKRVVVTGIGCITPLGSNINLVWEAIINSQSGIRSVKLLNNPDLSDLPSTIAGFIQDGPDDPNFNIDKYMTSREARRIGRFIQFGLAASIDAVEDSGIMNSLSSDEDYEKVGVLIGSGIGGLKEIEATVLNIHNNQKVSPFFIPSSLINLVSGNVAMKYGFQGPNHSVVTACATGSHAIGDAFNMIRYGNAEAMVAGGSEATICKSGILGFTAARALSTSFNDTPEKASRPWDKNRDGFIMSEGAGILVLEEYERAKARGAKIYGEIIGYGLSGDAYHITAPHPEGKGALLAMKRATENAKIKPEQIGYINAHGTSTPRGDEIEVSVVKKFMGNYIDNVSMSSTKSSIGHLLGAAGAVECIFSLLAMKSGILPPTLNLEDVDENCQGIDLVPLVAKEKDVTYVCSNSFGFGGTNTALIMKKFDA